MQVPHSTSSGITGSQLLFRLISRDRVRFDLLVHEFIRDAWNDKSVEIYGPDGWRPFLHVDDAARAVVMVCQQSDTIPPKEVYNVGANDQNFQKVTLGKLIQKRLNCELKLNYKAVDKRSYQVNFDKIKAHLGFTAIHTPETSIDQICAGLESGLVTTSQLEESVNVSAGTSPLLSSTLLSLLLFKVGKDDPIRKDTRTLDEIKAAKGASKQLKSRL